MRGYLVQVLSRPSGMFAAAFVVFALFSVGYFNVWVRLDADAAQSRFRILAADDRPRAASAYGQRVIRLRAKAGADAEALAPLKADTAAMLVRARKFEAGVALYREALATRWAAGVSDLERAAMQEHLARAHLAQDDIAEAASIYAEFLQKAGNASVALEEPLDPVTAFFAAAVDRAAPRFAEALKPTGDLSKFTGPSNIKLQASRDLAALGAYYAIIENGLYAAAGLLASAYELRKDALGPAHQETIRAAFILGPVYRQLDRLSDAEKLYLEAFHAQERSKGANNPDLSLYIKLLADVYEAQGRNTEAQALNEHMRTLFRDAFGAQRYVINRERDRMLDIDRPVSQFFILPAEYAPKDLVPASRYSIPISKSDDLDEMKIRLAADNDPGSDPREANLPARLAQLVSLCRSDTGEKLSLRSGYRSYATQRDLHQRFLDKGTVTPPGMSEHQLGLAVDIDVDGRLMRQNDASYQCFEENAFRFGFILSYPPGNNYLPTDNSFEPWHWRYVGISTAQLYRETGPANKPQEFLANLPCYQERAINGSVTAAGQPDVCLGETQRVAIAHDSTAPKAGTAPAARKLNNNRGGGGQP